VSTREDILDIKKRVDTAISYRRRFEKVWDRNYEATYGPLWKEIVNSDTVDAKYDLYKNDKNYRSDLILSFLKTELSHLMYEIPEVTLRDKGYDERVPDDITEKTAKEVNRIIGEMDSLEDEFEAAMIDAHNSLGITKTTFTPKYVENPIAGHPIVQDGIETDILEPAEKLDEMAFDISRVNPYKILIDANAKNNIRKVAFIGEEVNTNLEMLKQSEEFDPVEISRLEKHMKLKHADKRDWEVEITYYEIYNLFTKETYVIVEGYEAEYLKRPTPVRDLGLELHPYSFLRYFAIPGQFFPVPEVWSGFHKQKGINRVTQWEQDWVEKTPPKFGVNKELLNDADSKTQLESADSDFVGMSSQNDMWKLPLDMPANMNAKEYQEGLRRDFDEAMGQSSTDRSVLGDARLATELEIAEGKSKAREGRKSHKTAKWVIKSVENILMYMDAFDYGALTNTQINPDVDIEIDLAQRTPKNKAIERKQLSEMATVQPALVNTPTFMKAWIKTFDGVKEVDTIVDELIALLSQPQDQTEEKPISYSMPITPEVLAIMTPELRNAFFASVLAKMQAELPEQEGAAPAGGNGGVQPGLTESVAAGTEGFAPGEGNISP
jgi:hypothetical protein